MGKLKGSISVQGYMKDSPHKENDFNLIPSPRITMKGVNQKLKLFPIKLPEGQMGTPVTASPNKEYNFPGFDMVLEVPMKYHGGEHMNSPYSIQSQTPFMARFNASPSGGYAFSRYGGPAHQANCQCASCLSIVSQIPVMAHPPKMYMQQGGPAPSGYHFMPDGSLMSDNQMKGKSQNPDYTWAMYSHLDPFAKMAFDSQYAPPYDPEVIGGEEYNSRHIYGNDIIGYRQNGEPVYRKFASSPAPSVNTPTGAMDYNTRHIYGPDIIGYKPNGDPIYRQFESSQSSTPKALPKSSNKSKPKGDPATREMQIKLNAMGAGLAVDGIWGPKTQAAYDKYMGQPRGNTYAARNSDFTGKPEHGGRFQMGGTFNVQSTSDPRYRMYQDSLAVYNGSAGNIPALRKARSVQEWENYMNSNVSDGWAAFHRLAAANGSMPEPIKRYERTFKGDPDGTVYGTVGFKKPVMTPLLIQQPNEPAYNPKKEEKQPTPTGNQTPTYMGASIQNGMPQPLPGPTLQKETVYEPSLQVAGQQYRERQAAAGNTPQKPATYQAPQYQAMEAGKPLFNNDGSPVMRTGRAPLPAYLQAPNTTQAQRSAWWTANGYGPDGTGTYTAPTSNPTPSFAQGGEKKNWIPKNLKKGRCTPAPNPDCPVGSPQYNLAMTFKKHHGFNKKKFGGDNSTAPQGNNEDFIAEMAQKFLNRIAMNSSDALSMEEYKNAMTNYMQMGGTFSPPNYDPNAPYNPYYTVPEDPFDFYQAAQDAPREVMVPPGPTAGPTPGVIQEPFLNIPRREATLTPAQGDRSIQGTIQEMPQPDAPQKPRWWNTLSPYEKAEGILASGTILANMLESGADLREANRRKKTMSADSFYTPPSTTQRRRGDYDMNSGMFRPDQMVPVQFSGMGSMGYGYNRFQEGGEYYLDDEEINQILKMGGQIEYLD